MPESAADVAERPTLTWPGEQPTIPGADLLLRPWRPADVDQVADACQDPLIGRFTRIPQPYRLQDAVAFIDGSPQAWRDRTAATFAAVDPSEEDTVLVSVGLVHIDQGDLNAEIGYWTPPQHRLRGHTTTAVAMLTDVALRQWGFMRVALTADVANVASQKVAVAAGFKHEGIARCSLFLAGRHHDAVVFSRIRRDLTAAP